MAMGSLEVWTTVDGIDRLVLADIQDSNDARRLVKNLEEIYGDKNARVEQG